MKCPYCGADNPDYRMFCRDCNNKIQTFQNSSKNTGSGGKKPAVNDVVARRPAGLPAEEPPVEKKTEDPSPDLPNESPPEANVEIAPYDNSEPSDSSVEKKAPPVKKESRYRIVKKLGAGGMGRVFLAHDKKMDADVVVKEMIPQSGELVKVQYFQEKFKSEAQLLYRLKHRGIPKVTDYFTKGEKSYLVMEYIEGENLFRKIRNREDHMITQEEFFKWIEQILETLSFLHNQEPPVIHRDIKPANLMINSEGNVILVDFGLAKSLSVDTSTQTQVGTLGYASPEHYTGKFTVASDIYSLGSSFHFLLSGDPPNSRLPFEFPPISNYRNDIHPGVDKILGKMLKKNPKDRYSNVREVQEDLDSLKKEMDGKATGAVPVYRGEIPPEEFIKPWAAVIPGNDDTPTNIGPSEESSSGGKVSGEAPPSSGGGGISTRVMEPREDTYVMPAAMQTMSLRETGPNPLKVVLVILVVLFVGMMVVFSFFMGKKEKEKAAGSKLSAPVEGNYNDLLKYGRALMKENNYAEAEMALTRAVQAEPDGREALLERGKAYYALKKYSRALEDMKKVVSLDAGNIEALDYQARIYELREDYPKAVEKLSKIISVKKDSIGHYFRRADLYRRMNKLDQADKDYLTILNLDKDSHRARNMLAGLLYKRAQESLERKRFQLAISDLEQALRFNPKHTASKKMLAQAHFARGSSLMNRKDYKKALADYKKVLEINPKAPEILYRMGICRAETGDLNGAVTDLTEAYKQDPESDDIKNALVGVYVKRSANSFNNGQENKAIEDLNTALKYDPQNTDASKGLSLIYYGKGIKFARNGRLEDGKIYISQALKYDPQFADAYFQRSKIYFQQRDYKAARNDLVKTLQYNPGHRPAIRALEMMDSSDSGAPKIPGGEKQTEQDRPAPPDMGGNPPRKPGVMLNKTEIDFLKEAREKIENKEFVETVQMADRFLQNNPKSAVGHFVRGQALFYQGSFSQAKESFEKVPQYAEPGSRLYSEAEKMIYEMGKFRKNPPGR